VCAVTVPANSSEALGMLELAVGFLADADWAQAPAEAVAGCLRGRPGDLRTRPQRYHDALAEATRWL
jgi:hypothetical protein